MNQHKIRRKKKTLIPSETTGFHEENDKITAQNKAVVSSAKPEMPEQDKEVKLVSNENSVVGTNNIGAFKLASIDSLRESIKKTEQSKAEARKNVSIQVVKGIWDEYVANSTSKSVQSALNIALLSLADYKVHIKVPAQVNKDMILQEKNLLEKIRNESGIHDLIFEVVVDKDSFPDMDDTKPVQIMTQKEKYQYMVDKNPQFGNFVKKLGLKLDTEV